MFELSNGHGISLICIKYTKCPIDAPKCRLSPLLEIREDVVRIAINFFKRDRPGGISIKSTPYSRCLCLHAQYFAALNKLLICHTIGARAIKKPSPCYKHA